MMIKTRIRALFSVGLLSLVVLAAHATTVGFDDLPAVGSLVIPNGYNGFNWQNFYCLNTTFWAPGNGYHNGVVSPTNVAYDAGGLPASFSEASPVTFTLNSFYLTAAWKTNLTVVVTGYLGAVATHTATFVVSTGGPTLEVLNWSGIDSVGFVSSGGTPDIDGSEHFVIDDLTVTAASPVPEPGSLTLVCTGVLGLAGIGRRKLRS